MVQQHHIWLKDVIRNLSTLTAAWEYLKRCKGKASHISCFSVKKKQSTCGTDKNKNTGVPFTSYSFPMVIYSIDLYNNASQPVFFLTQHFCDMIQSFSYFSKVIYLKKLHKKFRIFSLKHIFCLKIFAQKFDAISER